jgi:hypothetical protein
VIRRFKLIPYGELSEILKSGETAFLEDSPNAEQKLRRQTIWKAAKKLSVMTGKPVVAQKGAMTLKPGGSMEGYLFSVATRQVQKRKSRSV